MQRSKDGSALVLILVIAVAAGLLLGSLGRLSLAERRLNEDSRLMLEAKGAAEATVECGFSQLVTRFEKQNSFPADSLSPDKNPLGLTEPYYQLFRAGSGRTESKVVLPGFPYDPDYDWGSYKTELIGGMVPPGKWKFIDGSIPGNEFDPLRDKNVFIRQVHVYGKATVSDETTGREKSARVRQTLEVRDAPLFAHAIFYNMDMEIAPGAKMDIVGAVHANGDLYIQARDRLNFHKNVSASGKLYHGRHPDSGKGRSTGGVYFADGLGNLKSMKVGGTWMESDVENFRSIASNRWNGNLQTFDHGIQKHNPVAIEDYVADDPETGAQDDDLNYAYHLIQPLDLDPDTRDEELEEQRFAYKAGVVIDLVEDGSGGIKGAKIYRYERDADGKITGTRPVIEGFPGKLSEDSLRTERGHYITADGRFEVVQEGKRYPIREFKKRDADSDGEEVVKEGIIRDSGDWESLEGDALPKGKYDDLGEKRVRMTDGKIDLLEITEGNEIERVIKKDDGSGDSLAALPDLAEEDYPMTQEENELDDLPEFISVEEYAEDTSEDEVDAGLYDYREGRAMNLVRFNMGVFRAAVEANNRNEPDESLVDESTEEAKNWRGEEYPFNEYYDEASPKEVEINKWTHSAEEDGVATPDDWWNGVVYVKFPQETDEGRKDGVVPAKRGWALQVHNGQKIPNPKWGYSEDLYGVTLATNAPLYVQGHYNSDGDMDTGSPTQPDVNDPKLEPPAAFAADAITVLSSRWENRRSLNAKPNARDTEISAAFLTGLVPSGKGGGNSYSGGVENFPRMLESWSGKTLRYRGSMVALFESEVATGEWSYGKFYTAPNRKWGFNQLYGEGYYPPGTPNTRTFRRINYRYMTEKEYAEALVELANDMGL